MTDNQRGVLLGGVIASVFIIGDILKWPSLISMVVTAVIAFCIASLQGRKPTRWQWLAAVVWVAVCLLIEVWHR
jgi:hypothetical protein